VQSVQLIIAGLVTGSVYALVASGLVVIYRASGVLNFAQGTMAAVAAFLVLSLSVQSSTLPLGLAALVAVIAAVALAVVVEVVVVWPLRQAPPLTGIVATLGVSLILGGAIQMIWGPSVKLVPPLLDGVSFSLASYNVSWQKLLIVVASLAAVGIVSLVLNRTTFGIAMRASNENAPVSALLGINLRLTSLASWAMAGALAGTGAVLVSPEISLTPDVFEAILIQSFVAFVLAGFTSIVGAVVGGYLVGISTNLFAGYVAQDMRQTFLLGLILLVLLVKPAGLFGRHEPGHG
jgi:branched-chain amino acid transport system permease protein